MGEEKWYLTTWFIAGLFAFWFLLVPLILGVYFLRLKESHRNELVLFIKAKEDELTEWENGLRAKEEELGLRFSYLQEKQDKVEREALDGLKRKYGAKEEELRVKETTLQSRERELELKLIDKQRELTLLNLAFRLRLIQQAKEREQLEGQWMAKAKILEEELDQKLVSKQQQIDNIELEHQRLMVQLSNEREREDTLWQLKVESKGKEFEQKKLQMQKEIDELYLLRQEQLTAQERTWAEELKTREIALESKEHEIELTVGRKLKELEDAEKAYQLRLIKMTKAREDELIGREKSLSIIEESILERENDATRLEQEIKRAEQSISILKSQIITLDDELLYQSFGFYETRYDMENSDEYKDYLEKVRNEQKKLVKDKRAVVTNVYYDEVDDSIIKKHVKLAIRSFNNECDSVISKVKFSNVEVSEKKIRTSFHYINELNRHNYIELAEEFLSLKLEELYLAYEYDQRKQEEREEQRRINEQIREERKAQQELEEQLKILRKEEQHLENALKHSAQFSEERTNEIKARLDEIQRQKEDVDYRIKNTKAGYVYVISNIGSFGENVYKIGMTRRLDPMDRVRELGGASVPFRYDVHAVIFSDNAPELEASLHRAFTHQRVNKINERKEFFRVSLKEIKRAVLQNHNAVIEFTMAAEAQEYRETKLLEKQIDQQIPS
ncbi:DUF4041 domain-containing protein [Paenibacillus sp. EPM92]|uniref:DUF4041 domain-containing protein n=1 Tax=Paenibacillus sp. EPM92 TaxID=1561195 RepID=UPI001915E8C6|nr:DUF4041 domain-containing protein [Paenibacillus sp. EPM92]